MKKLIKGALILMVMCLVVCASFTLMPAEAAEEGTSMANAFNLTKGVYQTKVWSYSNYKAGSYNKITIPERGCLTFSVIKPYDEEGEIESFDFVLYDSKGNVVWAADSYDQITSADNSYVYDIGVVAGTYYMYIDPSFHIYKDEKNMETRYKYDFEACDNWEIENNNSVSSATEIKVGKMYNGVYGEESFDYTYADYYRVYLNKGAKYVVNFENYDKIKRLSTLNFGLYDADGNNIALSGEKLEGKTTKWDVTVSKSGTYYLVLDDYGNEAGIDYKIGVVSFGYSIDELEIALAKDVFEYDGKGKSPAVTVKTSDGTALVEGKDYAVKYNGTYKAVGNYTVTVEFKGEYSGCRELSFKIVPKKVASSGIKATQTTTEINLSWNKVSQATGYRVYQYSPSKKKYVQVASVKTNSFKKTGLKSGTTYKFKIRAYKKLSDGTVIWAEDSAVFTTATKCKAPKITALKNYTNDPKVKLEWNIVTGATGYQAYYATSKNGTYKKISLKSADDDSVVKAFSSSASGKKIYFKVRAYKKVGGTTIYSDWSSIKSVVLH